MGKLANILHGIHKEQLVHMNQIDNGLGRKESLTLLPDIFSIGAQEFLKEHNYEKELALKNIKINRMKLWIRLSCVAIVLCLEFSDLSVNYYFMIDQS